MKKIDLILKNQNAASIYLANLAPSSRSTMGYALNKIARLLDYENYEQVPWHELRYAHTAAIRGILLDSGIAPATINTSLVALRGVLKECWRLGQIDAEAYQRAVDIKNVSGSPRRLGRALSGEEIESVMRGCRLDQSNWGLRDAALFAVLRLGLRRDEVRKLNIYDIREDQLLYVQGKGRKNRLIPIPNGIYSYLMKWIKVRPEKNAPLFVKILRGHICNDKRLTNRGITAIVEKRRKNAQVAHFTVHDWRRTCATELLEANVDLLTVQGILGHASPRTTAKYDKRDEKARDTAIKLIDL